MFKRLKYAFSHITSGHIYAEEIFEGDKEKTILRESSKDAFSDDISSFPKESDLKFPYVRPHFLCLSPDEVQASNNQSARPVIVPKKIFLMPLMAGYAECTNAYKTDVNEDQASAFILPLNSQYSALKQLTYFGLFDGHDGAAASILASQHLHLIIKDNLQLIMEELETVLFKSGWKEGSGGGGGAGCSGGAGGGGGEMDGDDGEINAGEGGGKESVVGGGGGGGNNSNSLSNTKKHKKRVENKNDEDYDDDDDNDEDGGVDDNTGESGVGGDGDDDDTRSHVTIKDEEEEDGGDDNDVECVNGERSGKVDGGKIGVDKRRVGVKNGGLKVDQKAYTDCCTQTQFDVFVNYSTICKHCGNAELPWQQQQQPSCQQHQQQQAWQTNNNTPILPTFEELIVGALEMSFHQMDELIGEEMGGGMKGGCAAMVVVVVANKLFVANAGDCRSVLYNQQTNEIIQLSNDHIPHNEQHRIRSIASMVGMAELERDRWTTKQFLNHPYQHDVGGMIVYREAWMNGWFKKTLTECDIKSPLIYGKGKRSRLLQTIGLSRVLGDHNLKLFSTDICIKPYLSSVPQVSIVELKRLFDDEDSNQATLTPTQTILTTTPTPPSTTKASSSSNLPTTTTKASSSSSSLPATTTNITKNQPNKVNSSSKTPTIPPFSTPTTTTNLASFLILASDGLWDTVSNQDAVACVLNSLTITDSENPKRFIIAAQDLVMMARIKNLSSAITAIPPTTTTTTPTTPASSKATSNTTSNALENADNESALTTPTTETTITISQTEKVTEDTAKTTTETTAATNAPTTATTEASTIATTATRGHSKLQWSTIDDISIFVIPLYPSVIIQ